MKRLALAMILAAGPALAQSPPKAPSTVEHVAYRIGQLALTVDEQAVRIEELSAENTALKAGMANLRAENDKLKKPEPAKPNAP